MRYHCWTIIECVVPCEHLCSNLHYFLFTKPSLANALQDFNGFLRALTASKPLQTAIVAAVALMTVMSLFLQAIWEHAALDAVLPPNNEA